MTDTPTYGVGDAFYQAAGGIDGLRRLVDDFYDLMEQRPEAAAIRAMHPQELAVSRDKLACFLSGWLGGPRLFSERYGPIAIPAFHAQWPINEAHSQAWLDCMAGSPTRRISPSTCCPSYTCRPRASLRPAGIGKERGEEAIGYC